MNISHHFGDGVYTKRTEFKAGEYGEKHVHTYDHQSVLESGSVILYVDDAPRVVTAPAEITIEAGKRHKVEALTDAVWLCKHNTDCTDPLMVDRVLTGGEHALD